MVKERSVSDESVQKATGRSWQQWFAVLNQEGAGSLSHKEIAQLLRDNGLQKEWWVQTVTVGYEYEQGLRVKGGTADAGFQVGVQKTIPVEGRRLWEFMTSEPGLEIWLGSGLRDLSLKKGEVYLSKEGTSGEIRSVQPGSKIRLTWQPAGWEKPGTVQVSLIGKTGKTALHFHQEKLSGTRQRQQMKEHWQHVLGQILAAFPD